MTQSELATNGELGEYDFLSSEARSLCEAAFPIELILGGLPDDTGLYNPETHARLCRLKLLGLSDSTAARAVGVPPEKFSEWIRTYPKLRDDIRKAEALSVGQAAALLRAMMHGEGPVALQAVKFFLSTRAPEFKEKTEVEITNVDHESIRKAIRSNMYGLNDESEPPAREPETDNGRAGDLIDSSGIVGANG